MNLSQDSSEKGNVNALDHMSSARHSLPRVAVLFFGEGWFRIETPLESTWSVARIMFILVRALIVVRSGVMK